jgi:hypothetical protein
MSMHSSVHMDGPKGPGVWGLASPPHTPPKKSVKKFFLGEFLFIY